MFGVDTFIRSSPHLKKVPMGLLTNHATFSASGYPCASELLREGFTVKKLFSPEHGVRAQGEDGKIQSNESDPLTKLPVVSLYGKNLQPASADLADTEIILIDLPNIGCRFYTYWWTITYMIDACAAAHKKVILLDRPNVSGRDSLTMEGPLLDEEKCNSFLGRWPMPLTYSYSYGELLAWFIKERNINVELEIISHDKNADFKSFPFIPSSPSMGEWQTTQIYPCTGLFEGINVSAGRGTAFPFRVLGAPWIDSIKLSKDFSDQNFEGIRSFPYSFQPMWSIHEGAFCHGVYFVVNDPARFRPVQTGIWLLNYLSIQYPSQIKPSPYPTAVNPTGENHLDRLLGIPSAFASVCSGKEIPPGKIKSMVDVADWTQRVDSFLPTHY